METKDFRSRFRQIIAAVFWPTVILAIIFFSSYYLLGDNPSKNIRIYYFAGLITYIITGGLIIYKTDENNIFGVMGTLLEGLFWINTIVAVILIIGFVLNLFLDLPLLFQTIFDWPVAISSAIILFDLAAGIIFLLPFISLSNQYDEF